MKRALALVAGSLLFACGPLAFLLPEHPAMLAWKKTTHELRGLSFVHRFPVYWIARDEIPELLGRMIDATYTRAELEAYRDAHVALGLLPPGYDLRTALLEVQQEELLGLYDPRNGSMYVVDDVQEGELSTATVVHELVHALQHQHFPGLFALQQGLRHNDDVATAIAAAIEGDASFTMLDRIPWARRDLQSAEAIRDQMLAELRFPESKLAEVPRLLRASLLFGYAYGTPIAARQYAQSGNAGLDSLLTDPPLSTLRAIQPEAAQPVEFVQLPLAALKAALEPAGCAPGHHNVTGVMTIRVLFRDHESALLGLGAEEELDSSATARQRAEESSAELDALLEEWSGDRFVHVRCGVRDEFAWFTRWQTPAAAAAFVERYGRIALQVVRRSRLAAPPEAQLRGRTALVVTPGVSSHAELLLEQSEVRAFGTYSQWLAGDCFPESPCPYLHRDGSVKREGPSSQAD